MSRQQSPFAALTGAEKQIKWLEYQSIRLPYVQTDLEQKATKPPLADHVITAAEKEKPAAHERPQPPPEVPRVMPDFQKTRHSQYDAVIARMKQAELQSRRFQTSSQSAQQIE